MESTFANVTHGLTLVGIFGIGGMLLREHKVFVRMKDRLNTLWYHHCVEKKEPYVSLDNGHS